MRRRFFWAMVSVAVITLAVGGVAAAVLIRRSVENSIRTEFHRQAAATARIIQNQFPLDTLLPPQRDTIEDAVDGVTDRPVDGLPEVLALVSAIGGHDYVEAAFLNARGEVLNLGDADRPLLEQLPEDVDLTHAYSFDVEIDGVQVAAVAQPFRVERRGTLVVLIGTNLELIPWNEVVARFIWAIALGVMLAALLAAALARRLARRVIPLQEASHDIASGDFGTRIELTGTDEITDVAQAFNEMASKLEAAQTREREFLVSVSHDLRTPLTTIAGYAEAMQEGRVDESDLPRVSSVLGIEAGRLRRLVEDLMLLARIEAREFTLRTESVDLAAHLKGALEGFRERADSAKVALEESIESVGMVEIDPDRVAQIVGNLLENALRYTPEAGRVTLRLERLPSGVRIAVTDTGPGIDAADLPHIFERLYVTARYRPVRPEGSGLGLSIVRELVDAMGGETAVVSSPGRGSEISVLLQV
jgi:signal transduction histidine kinase